VVRVAAGIPVLGLGIADAMAGAVALVWWGTIVLAAVVIALAITTSIRVESWWARGPAAVGGLLGVWVLANVGLHVGGW
jgi:hypothetical protein